MIDLYLAPGCTQSAKDKVHVRLMDDIIYIYIYRVLREYVRTMASQFSRLCRHLRRLSSLELARSRVTSDRRLSEGITISYPQ